MAITIEKAIEIGREAGLNLTDCRSLSLVADTEDQAKEIAAKFAPPESDQVKRLSAALSRGMGR